MGEKGDAPYDSDDVVTRERFEVLVDVALRDHDEGHFICSEGTVVGLGLAIGVALYEDELP